jgi:hypothetical protein
MIDNGRMRRPLTKAALASILFALLAVAVTVEAQQPGKIFRIGFLDPSTASGSASQLETFRQEMRKLGWIEGKNFTIEYRFAEQNPDRMPELAAELVRLSVDLIVTTGDGPTLAAKKGTTIIPIVMTTAWRQCHRTFVFRGRPKYQKAGDTQGRNPETRPSCGSAVAGCNRRPPTERAQACGSGTAAKIGGDRNSSQP